MKARPRSDSFENFYYTNVALGEGCGCAEKVIDVHDANHGVRRTALREGGSADSLWRQFKHACVIRLALMRGNMSATNVPNHKKRS